MSQTDTPGTARDRQQDLAKDLGEYKFGWSDSDAGYSFTSGRGLTREVVAAISERKDEPAWMRDLRLRAFEAYERRPMPNWGSDLSGINFDDIFYYVEASEKQADSWDALPPEIMETYEKLGIPEAERKRLIAGVAAQYECLAGPTRVYTTRGLRPIKEVEAGDEVFALNEDTHELETHPVKAKAQTGVRQTYEVVVGGSFRRTIRATDNHPFLVVESYGKGRPRKLVWRHLEDLKLGDVVAVARDIPDYGTSFELGHLHDTPEQFPTHTSVDLMWLLGLWLGDGCSRWDEKHGTYRVEFAIPDRDPELRNEITRVVGELFGLATSTPDEWRVTVNSKALVGWLNGIGVAGHADTKRIPGWVHELPREERLAFLGGYVDADGYLAPRRDAYTVALTSTSEALLVEAAEVAMSCGLRPAGPYEFTSKHPHDDLREIVGYRLGISGDYERLGCRNVRRTERFGHRSGFHSDKGPRGANTERMVTETLGFAAIQSIEPAEVEPVFDIEVDGPHNFVAEGIIVHNSTVLYHKVREDLEQEGVIFLDTDTALKEHEELFRKHFATVIPANDNKFAALNTAVWSGGSFIWIPEGVKVDIPLQAYFRINKQNMGQFERTLIIADPGSYVHYVEGCTAPIYSSDSLHSAVVEIIVRDGARVRYTTIQNWSTNVYNLVTKRAQAYRNATMEWIDGNIGSKVTMKYPAVWLMEEGAKGEVLSVAYAHDGQHQDAGAKMVHAAPNTTSNILSKSISKGSGRTSYRGLVAVKKGAHHARAAVKCDALMLDEASRSDTYPYMEVEEEDATIEHEATVSKLSDDQLFYLQARGITEDEATAMIVRGFIEPIARELPMEYAVELNRLIALEMEGAIG